MSRYTFEQYRSIFEGAIKKYEGVDFFVSLIEKLGKPVFPSKPGDVAIVGIRHEGREIQFRENIADDTIALIRVDESGQPHGYEYLGTTESGFFKQVINPQGDFKMSPGFYFFKRGLHHGQFPCLVQASTVIGERAKKGMAYNETDDKTWQIDDGTIHIHAGIKNPANVAGWSAGCTVIAGGWEGANWKQFYGFCKETPSKLIPYVLVNEADIPEFLADSPSDGPQSFTVTPPPSLAIAFDQPEPVASHSPSLAAVQPSDVQQDEEVGRELKLPESSGVAATSGMIRSQSEDLQTGSTSEVGLTPDVEAPATAKGGFLKVSVGSVKRMNAAIIGGAAAVVAGIKGFTEKDPTLSVVIILVTMGAVIWLVTWYIHVQRDLDKKRMEIASDPSKNRVR